MSEGVVISLGKVERNGLVTDSDNKRGESQGSEIRSVPLQAISVRLTLGPRFIDRGVSASQTSDVRVVCSP
jgi:hypothetical protein